MFVAPRRTSPTPTLAGWHRSRLAALVSTLCALSLLLVTIGATAAPAAAADGTEVALNIVKTATKGAIDTDSPGNGQDNDTDEIIELVAGETFVWLMQLTCSAVEAQCVDAVFTDSVPAEFEIDASAITVSGVAASNRTITVSGQDVRVAFHEQLSSPVGTTGLKDGLYWVQIPVKTRPVTHADNGREITNTGQFDASNAQRREVTDPATVRLVAPLDLKATVGKSFTPTGNLAVPDLGTELRLQGANTSNAPVDTLTIQDPANPSATPNIFSQHLAIDAVGDVTWPDGAARAELFVHRAGSWESAAAADAGDGFVLPSTLDLADVAGVRVVFEAGPGIVVGGTGGLVLDLVHRPSVSDLVDTTTLTNDVTAVTSLAGTDSSRATSTATYELGKVATSVSARKSFAPTRIAAVPYEGAGNTSTVTLGATNTGSTSLTSLTIDEPSAPTDRSASNPLAPAHPGGGLVFAGFTDGVRWPAGATGAEVTYHFASGAPVTLQAQAQDTLPDAPGGAARVTGFSVTFTGSIPTSAEALAPFVVEANPAQTATNGGRTVDHLNEISVSGTDPYGTTRTADAQDELTVYADQITLATTKRLTRGTLLALPGQRTTAALTTTITDFPATTRRVNRVEVVDPEVESGPTDWYRYFDAAAITQTQIPSNATLTVSYRDAAGAYAVVPGMAAITTASPGVTNGFFTAAIPASLREDVYGIKLTYESAEGFVPGQRLSPNLTFALRGTLRDSNPAVALPNEDLAGLENTTASQATAGSIVSNRPEDAALIDLVAVPDGGLDMLDKSWTTDDGLPTRSGAPAGVVLGWSTAGVSGLEKVVVSDTALAGEVPSRPLADSVFDAFDLVSIPAIVDPLLAHDAVAVQLYDGSGWVDAGSACRVASPCQGQFPAYALTAQERATTQAVRFVLTERSVRTSTDPADPQTGDGVALSMGHEREIRLSFALRDTLRSDSTRPVLEGATFNLAAPGAIRNTASTQGFLPGDTAPTYTDTDSDDITVADPDLGVHATKEWAGGPVAVPQDPAAPRPATRVTLTGTTTGAGAVDSLTVADPDQAPQTGDAPDTTAEFFDYSRFQSLSFPTGTTAASVLLARAGGGTDEIDGTPAAVVSAVLALSADDLADVVGITIGAEGRIRQGGSVRAVFDLRLRAQERTSGTAVTAQTGDVHNTVAAVVADPRYRDGALVTDTLTDRDAADVAVRAADLTVTATKAFSPAQQTEPTRTPVTMTLAATPGGSERTSALVLTDESATFWNAFDLQGVASSFALPTFSPAGSPLGLRVEVCVGRTFVPADVSVGRGCEADGGSWLTTTVGGSQWLTPAQVASGVLPAGVAAADVAGLRLTVQRLDGSQWENPYTPTISVPVLVQRRGDLRSGGPVPSTLADAAGAAPGETAKGTTTNKLGAGVTGILGGSATDSATASYTFRHALTGVRVEKSPTGTKAPGTPFDYTLSVTNTGAVPLVNPVIVDELPSDSDGAMLVFDPESEAGPTYAFALTGTAPTTPSGPQMPLAAADVQVTVERDGEGPSTISFAFPDQTVLEVGQTYTIVFPLQFRAGVGQGVDVTNAFGVKADRAFDTCTAPAGKDAELGSDGFCRTRTTVRPSVQPALRALKAVRTLGTPDDLGYTESSPEACVDQAAADDGFTSSPCVPRNAPGQDQEWRLRVVNQGTTELSRVVVTDLLPVPGDATVVSNLGRGSQWAPVFNGKVTLPDGAGLAARAFYTTAQEPCTTVLRAPAGTSSCSTDPSVGWAPWDAVSGVDPSTVTALQFEVDLAAGSYLQPGTSFDILVQTTAPAVSQTPGEDTVAFNSLSASAVSRQGGSNVTVSAADYRRVGLALVTGDVTLTKVLSGPVADQVPAGTVFSGELVCTSLDEEVRRPFSLTSPGALTATFEGLPAYATCEAVETSDSGQSSAVSSAVTVDPDATTTLPTITLTNDYPWASLRVSKQVTSGSTAVPTGFELTVACTFRGVPVVLENPTFRLDGGQERVFRAIPAQSDCTITETDPRDADDTIVTGASTTGAVTLDQGARTVTIAGLAVDTPAGEPGNSASFDNRYDADAALLITKRLVGASAAALGQDAAFAVQVRCTYSGQTVLDTTVRLHRGNGWTAGLTSVIAGASCRIVEDDLNGADGVTITPHEPSRPAVGALTVPETGVVEVVVENRYLTGSLEVTKVVTGNGAEAFGAGPFTIELTCLRDGARLQIPGGGTRRLVAGASLRFEHLPNGAECTVTETGAGGAGAVRVRGADGRVLSTGPAYTFTVAVDAARTPGSDEPQPAVTVENTFRTTQVQVTKEVRSQALGVDGRAIDHGTFTVRLACTLDGRPVRGELDPEQQLNAGQTVTWPGLPEGAVCALTEPDARGATTSYEVAGNRVESQPDGTLALGPLALDADRNAATVVNAFGSAGLRISKLVRGPEDPAGEREFRVRVRCVVTPASAAELVVRDTFYDLREGGTMHATVENLPAEASCTVTETDTGGARATRIAVAGRWTAGATAQVHTQDAQVVVVTVENTFPELEPISPDEPESTDPEDPEDPKTLPVTGPLGIAIMLAVGALLVGLGLLALWSARRRRHSEDGAL